MLPNLDPLNYTALPPLSIWFSVLLVRLPAAAWKKEEAKLGGE
jgi:hypothetical protein